MNNQSHRILLLVIFFGGIILGAGCSKIDDIQQKHIADGEIIYIAKPDSIKARGGLNRIELSWILISDPKIAGYKIYWNNRQDSLKKELHRSPGIDTVKVILEDLPEGTYNFEIYTFDNADHSSIQSTVTGKVYGDRYGSSLLSPSYRKLTRSGNDLVIEWMASEENFAGGKLRYVDQHGKLLHVAIPDDPDTTLLREFPYGGRFDFTSAFLPEPGAIDTFYIADSVNIPMLTADWTKYDLVFGHLGSLLAKQPDGTLSWYAGDGNGGFRKTPPHIIDYPWYIFNALMSYGDNVIGREIGSGFLYRYTINADGIRNPAYGRIGPAGWDAFDLIFCSEDYLYARAPAGELRRYALFSGGLLGEGILISGSYSQYNTMMANGSSLICRDADGTLWRIPVTESGEVGSASKLGEGWDTYDMISRIGEDILAKTESGKLWRYPITADGKLGEPTEVNIAFENI